MKIRFCKNCGSKVRRIRSPKKAYVWFCSLYCSREYHAKIKKCIENKKKEIIILEKKLNQTKEVLK